MSSTKGQSPKPATPDAPTKPKVAAIAAATKSASSSPASPASPASATNKQLNGKKQPAVATESPLSSTPTNKSASKQPVKESTPEPERNPDEKLNPYAEVIAKRLRALKKRLTKIEKNEELQAQGQKLDQDQLKSVSQKAEVMHLITELEEISKVFQDVTIEEEKLEKAEKKRLALEEQKKIATLKEQQQQEFKKLLEPLYVLSTFTDADVRTLLTTQGIEGFLLSQEELQILDTVTSTLYGKYQTSIGLTEASKRFFNRVKKLSAKGTENVAPGLTYTTAQALLQKISVSPFFDPELATKLATERANREAAEEAARKEQEEMHNSYEIIRPEEIPPFAPMSPEQMNGLPGGAPLAFLGESEVLGVQPVLSFDGSPAVVVPIPQTLFYAQIATPLYPSFRPTTSQPIISHHHQPVPSQQQPIAAAVPIPAAHEAAQPQQPTPSQDASIAAAPQNPLSSSSSSSPSPSPSSSSPSSSQPSQQRFNQNGRGRGNGAYRGNGSPQERRYSDRSPSSDRPPQQPRSERGASSAAHRGARGGFRGAKSPQAQTA